MAEDGMTWVRIRAPWNEIEPERGRQHWDVLQAAIDAAHAHDLRIVLLLDGAPAWAVKPEDAANPLAPPHDVRDFGRFAEAVAAGYGADVDIYQIWDEPNIQPHWGQGWVSPQGYFELLREAANSIRRADPTAQIMLAQLAPTTADDTLNLPDPAFLDRLYQLGAAEYFDAVAAAAYGFDQPPSADPAPDRLNFRRPELLRQATERHGDGDAPIWITSWGWWPDAAEAATTNVESDSPWGAIDPNLLPTYQADGLHLAQTQWPWSGPLAWAEYTLTPTHDPRRAGFAQRQSTGVPTLAGSTLRDLAAAPIPLGTGSHPFDNPALQVVGGNWRFSPAAIDPDPPGGAIVQYTFEGRAAAVEIQRGPYWATLKAWIDDQPAPLLPRDEAGDAYIALHDPANGVEVVPLARDLAPGPHTLRLEASAGWGQWFLRRLIIDHNSWPNPWPFWPIAALLILGLLGTGVLWRQELIKKGGRETVARWSQRLLSASPPLLDARPYVGLSLGLLLVLTLALASSPWLSLILLAPLTLLLWFSPGLAPALALAALPFYVHPKVLGPIGLPLHELLIWLGLGLWLIRRLLTTLAHSPLSRPHASLVTRHLSSISSHSSLTLPLLLFLLIALLSTLAAEHFGVASYEFRTVFLTPALFYWLVTHTELDAPSGLPLLSDGLVIGAVVISSLGLWQFLSGSAAVFEGVPRVSALYGSANNLALYLGRVLPLLVAVASSSPLSSPPRSPPRLPPSLALPGGARSDRAGRLLDLLQGSAVDQYPGGTYHPGRARTPPASPRPAPILAAALALIPFLGARRFTDLLNLQSGTTFFRLQLWQSAWRMFRDHPWLGVGPDNFLYAYRSHYVLPTAWQELNLSHPHNLFLDLLTRLGLLGFLAGLWLLTATLRNALALLTTSDSRLATPPRLLVSSPLRPYLLGLTAGLIAGLLHGLIDNSLFLPDLSILTIFVVAIVQRLSTRSVA